MRRHMTLEKIGFYLLVIDYLFITYIIFRIDSISYIYRQPYHSSKYLILFYGISVLTFPLLLLVYINLVRIRASFKEKMIKTKNYVIENLKIIIIPTMIANLFSLLFKDQLITYTERLSQHHKNHIVGSYYITLIIILVYSLVRTIIRADYYESHYLREKIDFRVHFIIILIIIMPIIVITFKINHF